MGKLGKVKIKWIISQKHKWITTMEIVQVMDISTCGIKKL